MPVAHRIIGAAVEIEYAEHAVFDGQNINVACGAGTFQVARVTLRNGAISSWQVITYQFSSDIDREHFEGRLEQTLTVPEPAAMALFLLGIIVPLRRNC